MKYSQYIGIALACIIIWLCFQTWVIIPQKQILVTGFETTGTRFGRPGMFHIWFSAISALLFILPFIWAKRVNVFFTATNLAWAIRNYIIVSTCFMGECPEKQWAIYLLPLTAGLVFLMALLPKIPLPPAKATK